MWHGSSYSLEVSSLSLLLDPKHSNFISKFCINFANLYSILNETIIFPPISAVYIKEEPEADAFAIKAEPDLELSQEDEFKNCNVTSEINIDESSPLFIKEEPMCDDLVSYYLFILCFKHIYTAPGVVIIL